MFVSYELFKFVWNIFNTETHTKLPKELLLQSTHQDLLYMSHFLF